MIILSVVLLNFTLMLAAYYSTSGPLPDRSRIVPLFATMAGIIAVLIKVRGKIDYR
jgi:membrane protease YdiL (CAAX protease family)